MSETQNPAGVLLLAYGGPRNEAEVEPYLARVTGGRPLSPQFVTEFRERYRRLGGRSPLPAITKQLARELQHRLDEGTRGRYVVQVGFLHSSPFIADAVRELTANQAGRIVAISLVPQYSAASVGRYIARLEQEISAAGDPFALSVVRSWATHPALIEAFATKVNEQLSALSATERSELKVVFSAHSVPVAAVQGGDPFEAELKATATAVAQCTGLQDWRLAYQSAGRGGGPWLGPTLMETLDQLADAGSRRLLVVPIHFLADNLEILYDIDVELQDRAARQGVQLLRTESLNTSPLLVEALFDLTLTHS